MSPLATSEEVKMAAAEVEVMTAKENVDEYKIKFLSEDRVKVGEAAALLQSWGCCVRCTIRFLGDKQTATYQRPIEELRNEVEKLISGISQSGDKDVTSLKKDGQLACATCLGILDDTFCNEEFITRVSEVTKKNEHQFDDFFISIKLPVSTILREHSVWVMLREQCKSMYYGREKENLAATKEVWKWVNFTALEDKLGSPFSMQSTFDICITFTHSNVERECRFLLDCFPNVFRKRKNNREGWELFTRTNVLKSIADLSEAKFKRSYQSPPNRTYLACECSNIACTNEARFMAGRYNKYCRELPQSPWILDGVRKADSSIQELICDHVQEATRSSDYRFSASGREDVDVRMLGGGRPFVIELVDPHKIHFTREELAKLQKEINDSTKRVHIRDLQVVSREDTSILKEGEENKVKLYKALCWTDKEVSDADLAKLDEVKDLVVHQQTPIRVLHRRAVATRERTVHNMSSTRLDKHHFHLSMCTQAGTYVKEFVHGDFGRTRPNLGELLGAECDILELDVIEIKLDWPPPMDYSDIS